MSEYRAEVLADSAYESPVGLLRVTTVLATFPRFILAEWNTHRMLSRNSNSSRAIPPERQIAAVRESPFVPATFNKRVKGMGVGEALAVDDADKARAAWLTARDDAAAEAEYLLTLDVDKSRINRLLEPFLWHTAIFTATDWDNVWALRDALTAQPEFQTIARLMREVMGASSPILLPQGGWHLPGLTRDELRDVHVYSQDPYKAPEQIENVVGFYKRASAGRLARWTSYDYDGDYESVVTAAERCDKLVGSFHLSPLEHQARPFTDAEWATVQFAQEQLRESYRIQHAMQEPPEWMVRQLEYAGNLRGFVQFRKEIPHEHDASLAVEVADS